MKQLGREREGTDPRWKKRDEDREDVHRMSHSLRTIT
jgi:hypothetical protein